MLHCGASRLPRVSCKAPPNNGQTLSVPGGGFCQGNVVPVGMECLCTDKLSTWCDNLWSRARPRRGKGKSKRETPWLAFLCLSLGKSLESARIFTFYRKPYVAKAACTVWRKRGDLVPVPPSSCSTCRGFKSHFRLSSGE